VAAAVARRDAEKDLAAAAAGRAEAAAARRDAEAMREAAQREKTRAARREALLERSVEAVLGGDVLASDGEHETLRARATPLVVQMAGAFGPADAASPALGYFAALRAADLRGLVARIARHWRDAVAEKLAALEKMAAQLAERASRLDARETELQRRERAIHDRAAEIERDAAIVEAARRLSGAPVSPPLVELAHRARKRETTRRPLER
jgi:colicin import membrane protein